MIFLLLKFSYDILLLVKYFILLKFTFMNKKPLSKMGGSPEDKQYPGRVQAGSGYSFEKGDVVYRTKGPSGRRTPLLVQKQNKLLNSLCRMDLLIAKYPFLSGVDLIARRPKVSDVASLDVTAPGDAKMLSTYIETQGLAVQTLTDFPEVLGYWAGLKDSQSNESKISKLFQELGLGIKEFAIYEKQRVLAEKANADFKRFMSKPGNSPESILKAIETRDEALVAAFAELKVLAVLYITFSDLPSKVKAKLVKADRTKEQIASDREKILLDFKKSACEAYLSGSKDGNAPFDYDTWLDSVSKG